MSVVIIGHVYLRLPKEQMLLNVTFGVFGFFLIALVGYVNVGYNIYGLCLDRYYSALLLSKYIFSCALQSPGLLVSYSIITLALHNT